MTSGVFSVFSTATIFRPDEYDAITEIARGWMTDEAKNGQVVVVYL